jgi:hypothetical protein
MEGLLPPSGEGGLADAGVASSMTLVVKAANQKYNDQTIECEGKLQMEPKYEMRTPHKGLNSRCHSAEDLAGGRYGCSIWYSEISLRRF